MSTALILLSDFQKTEIELWRPVEGAPDYEVSNLGRLRSYKTIVTPKGYRGYHAGRRSGRTVTPHLLIPYVARRNYRATALQTPAGEKHFMVHTLVARAFLPNPENRTQINHLTFVRYDNRAGNLEWSTYAENGAHATLHGVRPKGNTHWAVKIKDEDMPEVLKRREAGETLKTIALHFGVWPTTIWMRLKKERLRG